MSVAAAKIEELMTIHPKGFDLSLGRITALLDRLGRPQDKTPPIIHVAGTNGKGSTIAFMRSILEEAGLAVHVDISPHLVSWHERFRMGCKDGPGQLVDDATFANAIDRVAKANGDQPITVYEMLTGVMFLLFSEHPADVCLVEVGLGGRMDSTNVIDNPAVTVITPVSLDHEAYLGDTLAKIAFEKAGIIKRRIPVIIGGQESEALAVLEQQAARNLAPVQVLSEHYSAIRENGRMIFQDETALLDLPLPRLLGDHQISNAATAIAAVRTFFDGQSIKTDAGAFERGVANASWPGRMQQISRGSLIDMLPGECEIWLDGGHNPGAAAMISSFMADLEEKDSRPLILVCGILTTKDPAGYFQHFASLASSVITVPVQSSDAGFDPAELASIARKSGLMAYSCDSLTDAMASIALDNDETKAPRILIAGSLYLVGDALALNGTPPN